MMATQDTSFLQDVLVLSVRKNFWASKDCEVFPHRLYSHTLMPGPGRWGSSRNPLNNLTLALHGFLYSLARQPRLIVIGSATRTAPWLALLKKRGLLKGTKILATTQGYLSDTLVKYIDRVIVYSRSQISLHDPSIQSKYVFMLLPADGNFDALPAVQPQGYIFAGGGASRDFASLIEAVRGLHVQLEIVTFSPKTLGYSGELPANCQVTWKLPMPEFLERMAAAQFVVTPLKPGDHPHGHTSIAQAIRLGKAVITSSNASAEDYITDGQEGLLVVPGDVAGYRAAVIRLSQDASFRLACEQKAAARAADLTYPVYTQRLVQLCREMLTA